MVCVAFGASAVVAGAVDVFVDCGDFVFVDASTHEGSAYDRLLDIGEMFADVCGILIDPPEASGGVFVFVDQFCVCPCTCSGLGEEWLEGLEGSLDEVEGDFSLLPDVEVGIDLKAVPVDG